MTNDKKKTHFIRCKGVISKAASVTTFVTFGSKGSVGKRLLLLVCFFLLQITLSLAMCKRFLNFFLMSYKWPN